MSLPEPITATALVTKIFENLHVPYLIVGSFASTLYGTVRTTQDVDIVAVLKSEHIRPFITALNSDFFIDEEMIVDAFKHNASFNIIHRETMFKVDIFIPSATPFQQSQFIRAKKQIITDNPMISAYFASPEDTILSKLSWYRMGGEVSERQCLDIIGMLKVQANALDFEYMRKWAIELNIADLLEKAMQKSAGIQE